MHHQKGLTLVELLVTLVILAILVGVAFPGFQGMMARNNLATNANSMILAINLARGEAVRQSAPTTLVAIDSADANDEFGPGWQVLSIAAAAPDAPCERPDCIREFGPVAGGLTFDATTDDTFIQFTSRGALVGGVALAFDLCNPGDRGVRVSITPVGRASTTPLDAVACP